MNVYDKQNVLIEAIKDAEWRLGQYLAVDGTTKDDAYAKMQIKHIHDYQEQLMNLLDEEITDEPIKVFD